MESPLMLDTMRERMPGANVPLPYGGRVAGSNSLAYERNDCAGRGAHAILSAPAPIKNLRLETPLDVTVLIGMSVPHFLALSVPEMSRATRRFVSLRTQKTAWSV